MKKKVKTYTLYKPSITTFVDILGFREIIRTVPSDKISKSLKIIRELQKENSDLSHSWLSAVKSKYHQINFSDSTIRSVSYEDSNNISFIASLSYEIENLILIQRSLIAESILVRGGIADGNLHIKEDEVFGPGLVKAYDLESKFAIYPRIVLDPILIKKLNSTISNLSENLKRTSGEQLAYQLAMEARKSLIRSEDGIYYIDYLSYQPDSDLYYDQLSFEKIIIQHRKIIKLQTKKKITPDVQLKYNWLSYYHNSTVSKNLNLFKNPKKGFSYKITEKENKYII